MIQDNTIKLQTFIAHAGYCSRRKAEEHILDGRVTVNGLLATIGQRVDPAHDTVEIDSVLITNNEPLRYFLVNKPIGYVSTTSDEFDRPTVLSLIPTIDERVYPVGRLDADSSGLVLLTNDGDLTYRLTHPRYEINKTYEVALDRRPSLDAVNHLRRGVRLKEGYTSPCLVKTLGRLDEYYWVEITIHEGWNRQVRRMFERVGYDVIKLVRTKMGPFELDMLEENDWLEVQAETIKQLSLR